MRVACLQRSMLLGIFLAGSWGAFHAAAQVSGLPTADCHVTDGAFSACPSGATEWSDVHPLAFPATNSFLYVNQDSAHAFLWLMYDFPFRTAPLASTDSVHVSFDTVSQDSGTPGLEQYDIYIFGNGQMQILEQGQPTPPGRIAGAAGFGTSPNSSIPHLMAELQVPLTPGPPTDYSPDPLFWSVTVPPTPPTPPDPPSCPVTILGVCVKSQAQIDAWNQDAAEYNTKGDNSASLAQVQALYAKTDAPGCLVALSALGLILVQDAVSEVPEEDAEASVVAALANPELLVPAAAAAVALAAIYAQGQTELARAAAKALCANMTETSCMTAISEQGGKENQHGNDERFCSARYRCDGRS